MSTFEVGEVAIIYSPGFPWHGHECEILSGLEPWYCPADQSWEDSYAIRAPDFPELGCSAPKYLRKRRPPPDWQKLAEIRNDEQGRRVIADVLIESWDEVLA